MASARQHVADDAGDDHLSEHFQRGGGKTAGKLSRAQFELAHACWPRPFSTTWRRRIFRERSGDARCPSESCRASDRSFPKCAASGSIAPIEQTSGGPGGPISDPAAGAIGRSTPATGRAGHTSASCNRSRSAMRPGPVGSQPSFLRVCALEAGRLCVMKDASQPNWASASSGAMDATGS